MRCAIGAEERASGAELAKCVGRHGRLIGALLIGAAAGYAVHGDRQLVAGVSAGQSECQDVDGGTLCRIPVWAKLPPVAAAR